MPSSKQLLALGPPLQTRATNKDKRPGLPDVTNPRRKTAEVQQSRQEAARQQEEKENTQRVALKDIAELEDKLQDEDNNREHQRMDRYKANLQQKG